MPKVSVIIPCYNQGKYINEALDSVLNQSFQDFEIIVVNDGSTDENTIEILNNCIKPKTKIIHTSNHGLAQARNNGIKEAIGEYILPLDADDKIGPEYLEKASEILDNNPSIGIVYCNAEYFGDVTGKWNLPEFSFPKILLDNMIFCTAFFRRSDWGKVGGYKPVMKYGLEDHEFWLSLLELGRKAYKIEQVLFYYRQIGTSMVKELDVEKRIYLYTKLLENHSQLYTDNFEYIIRYFVNNINIKINFTSFKHLWLFFYLLLIYLKCQLKNKLPVARKKQD